MRKRIRRGASIFFCLVFCAILILGVGSTQQNTAGGNGKLKTYGRHYLFIADFKQDENFWNKVYEEAKKYGEATDSYVEELSDIYDTGYAKNDYLAMAVAMKVDGIICQGDEKAETIKAVQKVVDAGIPVVTVLEDCTDSGRQSFVSVGSYNIGREYARQIIGIATTETKKVLMLTKGSAEDKGENLIYAGLQEGLRQEGNHLNMEIESLNTEGDASFAVAETVRTKLMSANQRPDIILCMDEQDTVSISQLIVDYNMVDQVKVIGYYISDLILKEIQNDVVSASINIDAAKLGTSCVQTLNTYLDTGHVSDYVTLDVNSVTRKNVEEYIKNEQEKTTS
ncbi:MAG: sugar ABC transporter substrate-binding protein [Lachnospiraceae bacterium]|nr:sugar ABC transporter substrate-binding protein [Lachnospiraceae bacterium]